MTVKTVAVIGGGTMGRQIAFNAAANGYATFVCEVNPAAREKLNAWLDEYLAGRIKKGRMTEQQTQDIRARYTITENIESAVSTADLVIEAVFERPDLKHAVLHEISDFAPKTAIIATNSSVMLSSEFKDDVENPSRLLNIHYYNPAIVMKFVEVVKGPHTSEETAQTAMEYCRSVGKMPALMRKELRSFIANKIIGTYKSEVLRLVEGGYASYKDMDIALENGLGFPMGIFRLSDTTGVDTYYDIVSNAFKSTGKEPPGYRLYKKMVEEGRLGKKVGRGFYDYANGDPPKTLPEPAPKVESINKVAVIGGGLMGRQIGLNTAIYPYDVYVYEANTEARAKVKAWEDEYLAGRIAKGRMTEEQVAGIKSRFHLTDTMAEAVSGADLIIEAVPERDDLKHAVLHEISDLAREDAIIATNSSIMVSSEFKNDVKNPSRLLNIHYFNPALVMLLVEVVKGEHTDEKVAETAYAFAKSTGKTPVRVNKEIEGFLANRIVNAIKQTGRWLVENGYCTFRDVDIACEYGLGHPKGPFKLNDFTGLDLQLDQMERQWKKTGKKPLCYDLYKKMVDEGRLGVKSGRGFYDYTEDKNGK